ncbi:reverse transcriptase [Cucumis melo var. makuwa]|uniref:Reverse transcriptase n=1 Tax=Cucumis melo var. makuwa TaxID=1194695 RepID=A0A5D3E5R3_CUCMM|nr:reverse transcriptase [Cucumis melo var. makuwa]TYK30960.1 reverse transcriptase [Cucumis melo var. makuwa]
MHHAPLLSNDGSLAPIAGKEQIVSFDGHELGEDDWHCPASKGLYILDDDTSCSSLYRVSLLSSYFSTSEQDSSKGIVHQTSCAYTLQQNGMAERKNRHLVEVAHSLMLSTFLPSYLWGDAILTAAHLINRMSSRILHLQTPLDCLTESYPSTRLISEGESVSEESNSTFEFIEPTSSIVYDVDSHPIILSPNQVLWKTYYRRNLRKEVGSPTIQLLARVQDFEPPRDQGMENLTEPCTNNTMSENDRFDVAVLKNMEEKNLGDEIEVRIETSNDEAEQSHTRKLDEYDPSLDIPIALRKASLDSTTIPKNIYTALECPEWKNAVMEEIKALEKNRTWEIYALPKGHKTLDVKNAFLNGDLVEEIYMSLPSGFEAKFGQQVCKLQKSLYGLKQSPRAWFDRFTTFVKSQEYSQGHSDHTLFTKRMGDEFEIKDLGNLKYFLGMEVSRSKKGIFVSQGKYTLDLLTETSMLGCHLADTSIEFNCKLENSDDQAPVDKEQYQRLVGNLIYLSHTRLDISFAVSVVSQFMQAPYEKHMEAVKRILRYLKNTPRKGFDV